MGVVLNSGVSGPVQLSYLDKCPSVVVLCSVEPLYGGDHAGVVHLAVEHNLAIKQL